MNKILVTGANGQLGQSLRKAAHANNDWHWEFVGSNELDVTDISAIKSVLAQEQFTHCINCAAYTAVDKAEQEKERAWAVNALAPGYLAKSCKESNVVLFHISTDFVFDGQADEPYVEAAMTDPINYYGRSKLAGEKAIMANMEKYFIVRTSWLYAEHGHNFLNTMIRLGTAEQEIKVVNDQIGTPTYAGDLARVLLTMIETAKEAYGVYHYSNNGVGSWYGFAKAIFDILGIDVDLGPIPSKQYPTPAERPKYSVLDKAKVRSVFNLEIPHWKECLKEALAAHTKING